MRVFEPLLALPVAVVLHWYGLLGGTPLWLLMVLLVGSAVAGQPEVMARLAGRTRLGLHRVIAVQFGLTGSLVYLSGWGPLLAIVFACLATMLLRTYGSAAWRPAAFWTVVIIVVGQAGIALDRVSCQLTPTLAQVAGLLGAQIAVFLIRALGLSAEQRELAETEVRRREERFRALVQDSYDVVSVVAPDGHTTYVSPAIEHLTGLRPDEFMAAPPTRWLHADDHAAGARAFEQALGDPGGEHRVELRVWHADGKVRWVEVTLRNLIDHPAVGGLVATYRDVTERRAAQERLIHDARHDPLTGLANRAAFLDELKQCFTGDRTPAVLFVDLDGFKQVNDTYGHQHGDELIIAVAGMLRRSVLGSDVVGRLGGDEFGVVLTDVGSPDDAVTVAERILAEMDRPVRIGEQPMLARASIGVAIAAGGGPDELLHRADLAMYRAKRSRTHSFQLCADAPAEELSPAR